MRFNTDPIHLAKISLAALLISGPAFAQSTDASAETEEVAAEEGEPVSALLGAELMEQLAAEDEQMQASMASVTSRLETLGDDIENAEEIFDDMAAAIERQAALGDPEGSFVRAIEDLITQAEELEIMAREAGDQVVVDQMTRDIAGLEMAREETISLHADSFRALRQIKSQKNAFVLRIRAKLLSDAAEVAQEGVQRMAEFNGRLNDIRGTLPVDDESVTE